MNEWLLGYTSYLNTLLHGYTVQQHCVRESMHRVDPEGVLLQD